VTWQWREEEEQAGAEVSRDQQGAGAEVRNAGERRRLQGAGLEVLRDQEVGATGLIEGGAGVKIEGAEVIVHERGDEDEEAKAEAGRDLRRTRMDTGYTWQISTSIAERKTWSSFL